MSDKKIGDYKMKTLSILLLLSVLVACEDKKSEKATKAVDMVVSESDVALVDGAVSDATVSSDVSVESDATVSDVSVSDVSVSDATVESDLSVSDMSVVSDVSVASDMVVVVPDMASSK
jgi:hypothetical protein